jgi:ACS family glucarate transporter-like MFS transporter
MFFFSWFPTFLKETRGVSTAEAGLLTSLALWAVVLGSFAGGAVSDWVQRRTGSRRLSRRGLSVVTSLLFALFIVAAGRIEGALPAVLLMSAGAVWGAVASPCAYAITIDLGGRHVATVFSIMNMCGNLGAAAFPVVVPWLILRGGSWDAVLFVFAGIFVAAAFCWLMMDVDRPIAAAPQGERGQ